MTRKLASVRRISAIDPIPGADRIVVATIDGWKVVVKANEFIPGDLCVYFEIDSFLPVDERYEFLRKACFRSTTNLGDGFRIKTVKLRGQVSQGLALPVRDFPDLGLYASEEGFDATEVLGVKKWELPERVAYKGDALAPFPDFIPKTDQERVQNLTRELVAHEEEVFEVTIKLDGSSMTVYRDLDGYVGVCSRNVNLKEDDNNIFWRVAKESGLVEYLRAYPNPIAFQGELMGPGTQGNREGLKKHEFFLYDIYDIRGQRYLSAHKRYDVFNDLKSRVDISHVPIWAGGISLTEFRATKFGGFIPSLLAYAEGPSLNNKIREGLVFKSLNSKFTFKVIANSYLLDEE